MNLPRFLSRTAWAMLAATCVSGAAMAQQPDFPARSVKLVVANGPGSAPDLLARVRAAGVPVTTATDAHRRDRVGERRGEGARLLADAGEDVFTWRFNDYYGLNVEQGELWARFLSNQLSAASLAEQLQEITDRVRNDPKVERYTVS